MVALPMGTSSNPLITTIPKNTKKTRKGKEKIMPTSAPPPPDFIARAIKNWKACVTAGLIGCVVVSVGFCTIKSGQYGVAKVEHDVATYKAAKEELINQCLDEYIVPRLLADPNWQWSSEAEATNAYNFCETSAKNQIRNR